MPRKGLQHNMRVEFQPIRTVGLPPLRKRYVALTQSRRVVFTEDWPFLLPDGVWCKIPAGYGQNDEILDEPFSSDGSSYPRPSRIIFDPFGISVGAGIPHDFAYRYRCLLTVTNKIYMPDITRFQADDLFKRLNLQTNDIPELAYGSTLVLRALGGFAWSQHRQHDGTLRNDISRYL